MCGPLFLSPQERIKGLVDGLETVQANIDDLLPKVICQWYRAFTLHDVDLTKSQDNLSLPEQLQELRKQEAQTIEMRFDLYRQRYQDLHQLTTIRNGLAEQLDGTLSDLDEYGALPEQMFFKCLEMARRINFARIRKLNLEVLDAETCLDELKDIFRYEDTKERGLRLYALYHKVIGLPDKDVVARFLHSWRIDLPEADYGEYQDFVKENLDKLQAIKDKTTLLGKSHVLEHQNLPKLIQWELLGIRHYAYEEILRAWREEMLRIDQIASVREGITRASFFSRLSNACLNGQRLANLDAMALANRLGMAADFPVEKLRQLHKSLAANAKQLQRIKEDIDMAHHRARECQVAFGVDEDITHLKLSLNLKDIEEIRTNYKLRQDCAQEDIQLFAHAFKRRQECLKEALHDHGDDKRIVRGSAGGMILQATLKLELLFESENHSNTEILLVQRLLNFAAGTKLIETKTFKNIIGLCRKPTKGKKGDADHARLLMRLYNRFFKALMEYKPVRFSLNYRVNRTTFLKHFKHHINAYQATV